MSDPRITLEQVHHVARLARLSPSEEEASQLQADLVRILDHVASLSEVDTEGIEPTAHIMADRAPLRPDEVHEGLGQEAALAAAPRARSGGFSVPRVLETDP